MERVYRKREEIVSRAIAGETILVPVKGKVADMRYIFSLNSVAACLWGLIDGKRSIEILLQEIVGRFDVSRTEAEADIREFIEQLMKADLIEAV